MNPFEEFLELLITAGIFLVCALAAFFFGTVAAQWANR